MWVILAITCAFCQAIRAIFFKKISVELDIFVGCGGRFICLVPFAAIFVLIHGKPEIQKGFYIHAFFGAVTVTAANLLLAYSLSRLKYTSMAIALWKLSIVFLLVIEIVWSKQVPSKESIFAIGIIMLGVYILKLHTIDNNIGIFAPFKEMLNNEALIFALLSAVITAPACIFFKKASEKSDPFFSTMVIFFIAFLFVLPFIFIHSKKNFVLIPKKKYWFILVGFFGAISTICQNAAYEITLATFVEAIKQSEVLFLLVIDYFIAHKTGTKKPRLIGYIFLIGGTLLLIFTK